MIPDTIIIHDTPQIFKIKNGEDTTYIPIDNVITYNDPLKVIIENGKDTTGIDIEHKVEYWLLLELQQYVD